MPRIGIIYYYYPGFMFLLELLELYGYVSNAMSYMIYVHTAIRYICLC